MPEDRGPAAYAAEFFGTFALVFFITAAVSVYVTPATAGVQPFIDFSVIGLVHVFVLFMLIQTLAIVSGAHFNPAVTTALTFLRQIKPIDAAIYIVVQVAGGVLGAVLTRVIFTGPSGDAAKAVNYGAVGVSPRLGDHTIAAMGFEFIGTFFLVWAIVGVAVNPRGLREWSGFVIGGTLGLAVMVIAPFTGAGFNPARAFGPALVSGEFGGAGKFLLIYVLAPVVGAVVSAATYHFLVILPGKKEPGGMEPVG